MDLGLGWFLQVPRPWQFPHVNVRCGDLVDESDLDMEFLLGKLSRPYLSNLEDMNRSARWFKQPSGQDLVTL